MAPPSKRAGHHGPRRVATNQQRRELRQWWHDKSHGVRSQKEAMAWWFDKFGWELKTSTCSDILSAKFAHLDTIPDTPLITYQLESQRSRAPKWATLEAALIEWQIRYDRHPDSGPITGDLLRYKATEFWNKLPEYQGLQCPTWSDGWLTGFKKRYSIKERRRYGEAAGAQLDDECERIVQEIKEEAAKYPADCVYNMDETGKYWKMKPDRSLTTHSDHGRKKDKARITACLTCNATGTDRLPIWFIGKAKTPNCFKAENLDGLKSLGAFWRYNKKAWMNSQIMVEYLNWFNQEMIKQGKKALLLMDNFSAHELGVELAGPLSNVKVMWLPPNATSIHQPLDQGIIQNWKSFVQYQFVMFMAQIFDDGKDLSKEMHVLKAIRWGISAWENDVTPATIQSCWARSQVIDFGSRPFPLDIWAESEPQVDSIRQILVRLQDSGYLATLPNTRDYISPYSEQVQDDSSDNLVDEIVSQYTLQELDTEEAGEEVVPLPEVTLQEALGALNTLCQFEEQSGGNVKVLRVLRWRERELLALRVSSRRQGQLDGWLAG